MEFLSEFSQKPLVQEIVTTTILFQKIDKNCILFYDIALATLVTKRAKRSRF